MTTLGLSQLFAIPGEQGFPLNAVYKAPANKAEEGIEKVNEILALNTSD